MEEVCVLDATALLRIGDFLGVLPATYARSELGPVEFHVHPSAIEYAAMIPKRYGIEIVADGEEVYGDYTFVLSAAARVSSPYRPIFMTQAFFRDVRLPMPMVAPRPELELDDSRKVAIEGDVGLAPFARSLGPHEFWPRDRWQQLVDAYPDVRFILYGVDGIDDPQYVTGANVTPFFGYTVEQAAISVRDLKTCLISVVTGLSHIAFAVRTPNIVFSSQGPWGNQPDGIRLAGDVSTLPVSLVSAELYCVQGGDRGARVVSRPEPGKRPPPVLTDVPVDRLIPGLNRGQGVWIEGFGMVPNDLHFLRDHHFRALGLMV